MRLIACVLGHSLIGLLGVVLNFMPVSVLANANATPILPKGLSTHDWQSIQAAWQAGRHAVAESTDQPGTWIARNPGQQWTLHFDGRGFEAQPDGTDWRWGLQLQRWGMSGAEQVINGKAVMLREGQRARYQWSSELEEWYVNDARGLEHGYTVHTQPAGASNRLRFEWAVRGSLQPQIGAGGGDVRFVDADGVTNLTYAGLNVWDADGQPLPAVFESMAEGLALSVDTRNARYPITIDPIAQQAYLKASNTGVVDSFGWSVAISGDTVVVGAQYEDSNSTTINGDQSNNAAGEAGAAYVFVRTAGIWSQQAYLKASNTDADDRFGISVAISGDTIVVGAIYEDSNSVVINAGQGNNAAADAGAAYVFVRSGSIWSQQAYLKASNTDAVDRFGGSVAIFNNTVVVGAVNESSNSTTINGGQSNNAANYAGAAYVFERSGSSWSQQAYLKASNTDISDFFGLSVAVAGNTIAVGTAYEDSNSTVINGDQSNNSATSAGAVYVFERSGTSWSQQAYLKASNTDAFDYFGYSVAIFDNTLLVGAFNEDSNSTSIDGDQGNNAATNAGAAYVFERSGSSWSQQAYLKASNTNAYDYFGYSVAISGDTVVVAARDEDSNSTGIDGDQGNNAASASGAAYVFVRDSGNWSQQTYLKASNTGADDNFGFSVAISGDTAVIGATDEDSNSTIINGDQGNNAASYAGAAYVFQVLQDDVFKNGFEGT